MSWAMILGEQNAVTPLQETARAVLIFAYGLVMVRLAGRRMFAKWSALDTIASIIVGSNLSRALTGNAPLGGTLLATTVLVALHGLLAQISARVPRISRLIEGRGIAIATDGKLDSATAVRSGVSEADLHEALRRAGVERIEETRRVTIEAGGEISVLKTK